MDEKALLASVYCPPEAGKPWRLEDLLAPAQVRYYGLGRAAMTAAFRSAGLGLGDAVLFPALICGEAVEAATVLGCEPRYYPVAPGLEAGSAESEWPQAKAVVAVDYFGFPQDLAPFHRYASRTRALVIEDNAHGLFSRAPDGALLGLRADAGIFSLRKTIALANGAALAVPPGGRVPLPAQGSFQAGEPARFRVKRALRRAGRAIGSVPLRALHRLARGGAGGGGGPEGPPDPPVALAGELRVADPELEVERRRALYLWCDERARPLGAQPVFPALPTGVSPFAYAYRASAGTAEALEALFDEAGLDVFSWPELPRGLEDSAPEHYRDIRCVRFLW